MLWQYAVGGADEICYLIAGASAVGMLPKEALQYGDKAEAKPSWANSLWALCFHALAVQ